MVSRGVFLSPQDHFDTHSGPRRFEYTEKMFSKYVFVGDSRKTDKIICRFPERNFFLLIVSTRCRYLFESELNQFIAELWYEQGSLLVFETRLIAFKGTYTLQAKIPAVPYTRDKSNSS